jgi:hypothetical protein
VALPAPAAPLLLLLLLLLCRRHQCRHHDQLSLQLLQQQTPGYTQHCCS